MKVSNIDIFECYFEEKRRKFVCASLLTFGYRIFQRAMIINRLNEITNFYHDTNRDKSEFKLKFAREFGDVLNETLIDAIKISTCFENYFKVKLLLNGYLIHNIKNVNTTLAKDQKVRPIKIEEALSNKSENDLLLLKSILKELTITYSTLLEKQDYYKHFFVDKEIIEFLKYLNKLRNRLHLYLFEIGSISKLILKRYSEVKSIVEVDIASLQNKLFDEVCPDSRSRIALKF